MRLGVVSSSEVGRLQIAGSSDEVCDMRRAVRRRGLGVMASRGRACRGRAGACLPYGCTDERVQGQGNRPAVRQLAMRQAIYRHAAPTPDRGFLPRLEATFLCFLGGEVATDEAPVGPVRRGVDIVAANAEKTVRLGGRRAAKAAPHWTSARCVRRRSATKTSVPPKRRQKEMTGPWRACRSRIMGEERRSARNFARKLRSKSGGGHAGMSIETCPMINGSSDPKTISLDKKISSIFFNKCFISYYSSMSILFTML